MIKFAKLIALIFIIGAVMSENNQAVARTDDAKRAEIFEGVKNLIKNRDSFAAVDFLNDQGEPEEVAEHYANLINDFYWKDRDIYHTRFYGLAGIQYSLSQAEMYKAEASDKYPTLKNKAKVIAYNLSSFLWPGWDESGISLTFDDITLGLDAARLNLRLAQELGDDESKLASSYWMVGAQLLALQRYDEATKAFETSRQLSHQAGEKDFEFMAEGYVAITQVASGDPSGHDHLGEAIKKLTDIGSEDALFFVEQFNTVLNVFIK